MLSIVRLKLHFTCPHPHPIQNPGSLSCLLQCSVEIWLEMMGHSVADPGFWMGWGWGHVKCNFSLTMLSIIFFDNKETMKQQLINRIYYSVTNMSVNRLPLGISNFSILSSYRLQCFWSSSYWMMAQYVQPMEAYYKVKEKCHFSLLRSSWNSAGHHNLGGVTKSGIISLGRSQKSGVVLYLKFISPTHHS